MVSIRSRIGARRILRSALVVFFLGARSACAANASSSADSAQMPIPLTTIQKGNFSGIGEALEAVMRTPTEWENLWKRHVSIQSPPAPIPPVDFAKEMVAAVFLGQKNTGGYEVEITKAQRNGPALQIFYNVKAPQPGGMAIQAITQPFHIVKMPRSDGTVRFSRTGS